MQKNPCSIKKADNTFIYLDNAATTKPNQKAIETALLYLTEQWFNPSSLNSKSKEIHDIIEQSRKDIANYIGANSDEIYFTSGGSESNSWAIQGFVNYWTKRHYEPVVITSEIEHKSIIECVKGLNVEHHFIPVDRYGFVKTEELSDLLRKIESEDYYAKKQILVSIQFANNETGVIQPIKEIADIVHQPKYNCCLHVDGVQAVGKLPINVEELGIDMLSASAHKFGGLKGNGFLYIHKNTNISPIIYGTQNNNMRGGTENVFGIVNMATALKECDTSKEHLERLTQIKKKIKDSINRLPYEFRFNSEVFYDSLPNILSVTILENVTAEAVMYILDTANIVISSGSACNSKTHKPSHVLKAIGLSDWDAVRTIRVSFDDGLTENDINVFVSELEKAIKLLAIS